MHHAKLRQRRRYYFSHQYRNNYKNIFFTAKEIEIGKIHAASLQNFSGGLHPRGVIWLS